ncbi:hypothetical protein [Streptomyces sp. NPDC058463]|uniref:hypothetical protein n=1 Tax=Streptomyces sp. NPDC058463 TaxID=3346510 RepID=UPI00365E4172
MQAREPVSTSSRDADGLLQHGWNCVQSARDPGMTTRDSERQRPSALRFTDPGLCSAIVDRLTFNGTIIETGTASYRLASTRARAEEPAKAVRPWRAPTRFSGGMH